jgi:hypothetical protein
MGSLDQVIEVLQQRIRQARQAKKLFANDPALADKMARALLSAPLTATAAAKELRICRPDSELIRSYFTKTRNEWAMLDDIAKGTGIQRKVIARAFYTKLRDEVESKLHPAYLRVKIWRLKEPSAEKHLEILDFPLDNACPRKHNIS